MKKMYLFALLALSMLSYGQNVQQGDFVGTGAGVQTGNLTTTSSPWYCSTNTTNNVVISSAGGRTSGSVVLRDGYQFLRQSISGFTVGTSYTLRLWHNYSTTGVHANELTYVNMRSTDSGNPAFSPAITRSIPVGTVNTFTEYTLTFTAPATSMILEIQKNARVSGSAVNNQVRLDDISIGLASTIPITPVIGTYTYNGSQQGPDAISPTPAADSIFSFTYAGTGSTIYPSNSAKPTNAGTYAVTATVSGNTAPYSATSSTTPFTIAKATPTITVRPTASVLTQGSAMSAVNYSGGAVSFNGQNVVGSFTANSPTYVPPLGIQNRTVNFVPTDNTNFNNVSINDFAITAKSNPAITVTGTTIFVANGSAQGPNTSTVTFPSIVGPNGTSGTAVAGDVTYSYVGTGSTIYAASATRPTAAGTYSVTATSAATDWYFTSTSAALPFTILAATTFTGANGGSWDMGAPTANVDAVIDATYRTSVDGAINAKNLTVSLGETLYVEAGANVTVQNTLTNDGFVIVENNANFIQTAVSNTNTGSGSGTVYRNGSTLKRLDYTLWSSPVAGQNLLNFSPLTVTPRFYTYNEGNDKFSVVGSPSGTTFTPGSSFFIRMPDVYPEGSNNQTPYYLGNTTLAYPGVFTGTLNNGNVPVTLTKALNGYQAVGNPYPSVLDAELFLDANASNIEPTLYFWRKTNGAGTAYASYTDGGGTSTTATSGTPNGKIQVGQGFIVQAKQAGTVANFFTNSMRETAPTSTQFFKTKQAQKDRLWLNLTGANDVFSQALVAYVADGSLGLDKYDGKYINDSDIALTSSIAGNEYTIQGRPAFDATDVVALNFKTSVAGTYTIAIDHVDGLFSKGQDIYLVDKKVGVTTNLNEGAYNFTAEAGVDNTRFELTYQKTLKVDAPLFNENSVLVSRSNGTVNVKSSAVAINNIKVYDVQGRLVAERKNVKSNSASFSNMKANQVLIVKVTAENNAVVTKKVLN